MVLKNSNIKIPNFKFLEETMEQERRAFLRANNLEENDSSVRSTEQILFLFPNIEKIYLRLFELINVNPSYLEIFDKMKLPVNIMFKEEFLLESLFIDQYLLPKLEHIKFYNNDQEEDWEKSVLHFLNWIERINEKHELTSLLIKNDFSLDLNLAELECSCSQCKAEFRTKLRDQLFNKAKSVIEKTSANISSFIDQNVSNDEMANEFYSLQKELEKLLYKFKYQLRKSSVKRLDLNIKSIIKAKFLGNSDLAVKRKTFLKSYFIKYLDENDISTELISDDMFEKFFKQQEFKIWQTERNLDREFRKVLNSILVLKRNDISGTILKDYIGNFWVHSISRNITRKIVYHMGPTNSGKTYHAIEALCKAKTGCYLAPLRLLAGELYDTMNTKNVVTTLLTGEEVIDRPNATHFSSTIEMARLSDHFECCVIDEIQMITDSQRGWAWTRALVNMFADEIHICGDGSVLDLVKIIVDLCGDTLEIKNYQRMTELIVSNKAILLTEMQKSDALIVFSRRNALRYKRDLEKLGYKVSIIYGRLSPEVRREQARKFDQGETDIIVSTDAIAMGMNLPIKRIVFSTLSKYIDGKEHVITNSEIKQIAGRAGRYQRFPTGFVTCLERVESGIGIVEHAIAAELDQRKYTMVGADLDIFNHVNDALRKNKLETLKLSEFLRLFNTMEFQDPFKCVELKEMIDVSEMVEEADIRAYLNDTEIFGFACAPVNLGLMDHVQYFVWIVNNYVNSRSISFQEIDANSHDIDYLETQIKCMELFQWLSRHFSGKNFDFNESDLVNNKSHAVDKLNTLLSEKIVPTCRSCGCKLPEKSDYAICEDCFKHRRFANPRFSNSKNKRSHSSGNSKNNQSKDRDNKSSSFKKSHSKNSNYKKKNKKFKNSESRGKTFTKNR